MRHPKPSLSGRTAVITGAGSGIGRAMAQRLARHGCPLALVDVDEDALAETAASIDTPVMTRTLDVRDRQAQLTFAASVAAWAPAPIGLVFNNAGVALSQTIAGASPEDDEWVMQVNFEGVVNGVRAFLPILVEQDAGVIVNTSSVFGLFAFPTQSAYCASKFAVRGFTDTLRHELRGTGVCAVNVHPGGVKTNIVRNGRMHLDPTGEDRSKDELAAEFEALAMTTPERAAKVIHKGIEAGKARILVGPDAYFFDALARIAPTHYYGVLERLEPIARRLRR
jgi:NADP-dependent 3-hydroxy acid dehydrogenase YdfG